MSKPKVSFANGHAPATDPDMAEPGERDVFKNIKVSFVHKKYMRRSAFSQRFKSAPRRSASTMIAKQTSCGSPVGVSQRRCRPTGRSPVQTKTGELYFFNFKTGESSWEHPSDEKFRQMNVAERKKPRTQASTRTCEGLGSSRTGNPKTGGADAS